MGPVGAGSATKRTIAESLQLQSSAHLAGSNRGPTDEEAHATGFRPPETDLAPWIMVRPSIDGPNRSPPAAPAHEAHQRRIFAAAKTRSRQRKAEAGQRMKHTQRSHARRSIFAAAKIASTNIVPSLRTLLSLAPDPPDRDHQPVAVIAYRRPAPSTGQSQNGASE